MKKIFKLLRVVYILLILLGCSDFDDKILSNNTELIKRNEHLYTSITTILSSEDVCVDFNYPINLFKYNESNQVISIHKIHGDSQFLELLFSLNENQSVSISYPIEITLDNGDIFSVTNNNELIENLQDCFEETIVKDCSENICSPSSTICFWKPISKDLNTLEFYLSNMLFFQNNLLYFYHNNQEFLGTWNFVFINNKLFLNLNFTGNNNITMFWNKNWEVIITSENEYKLTNNDVSITIFKHCSSIDGYNIGEEGPAGGIVFYDKGSYSNGWRYIEISENYLTEQNIQWGCSNYLIPNTFHSIGKGIENTKSIIKFHKEINYIENPLVCGNLGNGSIASLINSDNNNLFKDWIIPTFEDCEQIVNNLYLLNLGQINQDFWCSTQFSENQAYKFNSTTGQIDTILKSNNNVKVRPIRYF